MILFDGARLLYHRINSVPRFKYLNSITINNDIIKVHKLIPFCDHWMAVVIYIKSFPVSLPSNGNSLDKMRMGKQNWANKFAPEEWSSKVRWDRSKWLILAVQLFTMACKLFYSQTVCLPKTFLVAAIFENKAPPTIITNYDSPRKYVVQMSLATISVTCPTSHSNRIL